MRDTRREKTAAHYLKAHLEFVGEFEVADLQWALKGSRLNLEFKV